MSYTIVTFVRSQILIVGHYYLDFLVAQTVKDAALNKHTTSQQAL